MHKNRQLSLEQYQTKLKNRVNKMAFLLENIQSGEPIFFRPNIRSMWHVDFMNAYFWQRQIKLKEELMKNPIRFLTLTYNTKLYTPEQVAKRHKNDWKKFIRTIRTVFGNTEYCYFIELTKQNYVHFHIYIKNYLPQQEVSKIWQSITGSKIVFIKYIDDPKQINYVSNYHNVMKKYTQEQLNFAWKNISRFFGQSRHFFTQGEAKEIVFNFLGRITGNADKVIEKLSKKDINQTIFKTFTELFKISYKLCFQPIPDTMPNTYRISIYENLNDWTCWNPEGEILQDPTVAPPPNGEALGG